MNSFQGMTGSRVLFDNGQHKCVSFSALVKGEGVQANQFLIIDHGRGAIIDPGGDLTYTPLTIELNKHVRVEHLDYVFASHQDPDVIASLPRWLVHTKATVVASKLWARFFPHLASSYITSQLQEEISRRLIELPDAGKTIPFGDSRIVCVPAHFLHSVGNFQFYDPVAKILFSGDMGASLVDDAGRDVADFQAHIPSMEGFHRRYMCSRKVTRLWADMVRKMDVELLVPQHGKPFRGREMIHRFLDWISELECGIDRLEASDFQLPH